MSDWMEKDIKCTAATYFYMGDKKRVEEKKETYSRC